MKSMLTVSEAVTRSNVIVRERNTMTLRQSLVPEMPNELTQLVA
jgi:hypothetical protein